jgi:hypothetical protein
MHTFKLHTPNTNSSQSTHSLATAHTHITFVHHHETCIISTPYHRTRSSLWITIAHRTKKRKKKKGHRLHTGLRPALHATERVEQSHATTAAPEAAEPLASHLHTWSTARGCSGRAAMAQNARGSPRRERINARTKHKWRWGPRRNVGNFEIILL